LLPPLDINLGPGKGIVKVFIRLLLDQKEPEQGTVTISSISPTDPLLQQEVKTDSPSEVDNRSMEVQLSFAHTHKERGKQGTNMKYRQAQNTKRQLYRENQHRFNTHTQLTW